MIIYFIIFIFGLSVGSFLNAVIFRLDPTRPLPLVRGGLGRGWARSYCPHCRETLKWPDLIPVFSFLFLRGKCRYCGKNISWQYPIVEVMTAVIFLLIFWEIWTPELVLDMSKINFGIQLIHFIYWFYIASVLIIIFVYDLKHYIIPDKILFPAIIISLIYLLFRALGLEFIWDLGFGYWDFKILITPLLAAFVASVFFLSMVLISRGKWMGLGDAKLAFLMGLVLGWPNIFVALLLAFFSGALVGLALILISGSQTSQESQTSEESLTFKHWNYTLKSQIPFGPFLIAGTFIALFWGEQIINWYSRLFF